MDITGVVDAATGGQEAGVSPAQPAPMEGPDAAITADGTGQDPVPPTQHGDAPGAGFGRSNDPSGTDAADPATAGGAAPAAEPQARRQLHPLPRGLVELYGLLAVLFVLVPEWMAGGALFGFRDGRHGTDLPAPSGAWKRLPELRLASLNLGELRQLAGQLGVRGYGRLNREALSATLLRRLRTGR